MQSKWNFLVPHIDQKILESEVYSPASITKELLSDNLIEDSEYDAVRRFIHRYISVPSELEDFQEDNIAQFSNFIENETNKTTENMRIKSASKYIESSILVIPDLHLPFILSNFLEHCVNVRNKFKCKHIIFIGDILDNHYSSYHETNPNGYSALQELELAIDHLKLWIEHFQDAIVIKGNHDCHSPDTQALTKLGWKYIKDITLEDEVAELTDNGIVFSNPLYLVQKEAKEYYHIETAYSLQKVTANHRCLLMKDNQMIYKSAKDITEDDLMYIPENAYYNVSDYNISDDELRLLVQVIMDATLVDDRRYKINSAKRRVQFKLSKQRKIDRLVELLTRLGIKYSIKECKRATLNKLQPYYIRIYSDDARNIFNLLNDKKEFPNNLLSKRQLEIVLDELCNTDGNLVGNHINWSTINKNDVDYLQWLCTLHGYRFRYTTKYSSGFENGKMQYVCTISKVRGNKRNNKIELIQQQDTYYCLTMPHSNFITRVDGKISISGNCLPTRKAITSGLANRWIRPFKEVLDTPNWEFVDEYELQDIIFTHGHLTKEAFQECLLRQKPVVSGHRHGKCYVKYQTNKLWGMQVGIGFDKTKYAFNYAGNTTTWVENVAVIFDGVPILQPFRK